ncbi:MliC family protein [Candidatus Haliotispira prima]|uniref:MliC family protein n=1 Tax=Candidatus Haliotispira prima TaxID=3034016 RepID=A0ABY8MKJ8_9SPIO|nr:MliC family protein [Candidatus Haliotispira prima]
MKKYFFCAFFFIFCHNLFARGTQSDLTVIIRDPLIFYSQNDEKFVVTYGDLSDDSLSFLKIILPDGSEKTLIRVVSGSGERFSERDFEWWEHQGTVCLSKRDDETREWIKCHWQLSEKKKSS